MLSCLIDGQVKHIHLNGADNLATILNNVNSDLAKGGRFIASLRVNGEEVEGDVKAADMCLDVVNSIEITTESPLCLAGKILDEGGNYLDGLMTFLTGVAGNYGAGNENADDSFAEAIKGLQWFVQMTDFIENTLRLDFGRLTHNGRTIKEYVNILNTILLEMAQAQESNDPVILADLLEYDLVPHLGEWKDIYRLFQRELGVK
jgi:hypothetical protein